MNENNLINNANESFSKDSLFFLYRPKLDFLKEYLNLIVIIPVIIGGIWQILELISIQFSLIRFFSISQLIADGLLILVFSPAIFFFIFPFLIFDSLFNIEHKKIELIGLKVDKYLYGNLFKYGIIILITYFLFDKFSKNDELKSNGAIVWFLLISVVIFAALSYFIKRSIMRVDIPNIRDASAYYKGYLIIFLGHLILLGKLLLIFHFAFFMPKELINKSYIDCKIQSLYPNQSYEIKYFNDKYIFLEIKSKTEITNKIIDKKILIIKFEEMLN